MKKQGCKAGQFYCAKYKGKNGDVIVAVVKSVRKCGDVILTDLLTGARRTKAIGILLQRNKRVTKEQICSLQAIYAKTGDLQKVREAAVKMPALTNGDGQQELPLEQPLPQVKRRGARKWRQVDNRKVKTTALLLDAMKKLAEINESLDAVRGNLTHIYEASK